MCGEWKVWWAMMITPDTQIENYFSLVTKKNNRNKKNARFEADYALNERFTTVFLFWKRLRFIFMVTIFNKFQFVYKFLIVKYTNAQTKYCRWNWLAVDECDCLYLKSIKHHMAASGTQHWITILPFGSAQFSQTAVWLVRRAVVWVRERSEQTSDSSQHGANESNERMSKLDDQVNWVCSYATVKCLLCLLAVVAIVVFKSTNVMVGGVCVCMWVLWRALPLTNKNDNGEASIKFVVCLCWGSFTRCSNGLSNIYAVAWAI